MVTVSAARPAHNVWPRRQYPGEEHLTVKNTGDDDSTDLGERDIAGYVEGDILSD